MVKLGDGSLLTVYHGEALVSQDEGRTWKERGDLSSNSGPGTPSEGLLIRTRGRVVILVYGDINTFK